jgi:cytochrome c peroxidase
VDLPVIWNQKVRVGLWLHWDGNNNEIRERNYAAAMAIGATPFSVIEANFNKVTDFVLELPPPKFPFEVDTAKAEQGWNLYEQHCASCHQPGAEKVGTVTNIEEIGTDRHRLDSFTEALVEKFHSVDEGPFKFNAYRKTQGYSNLPLDGVWARAPYLHNGSAVNLWQLLTPPAERLTEFYRGYPVYDPVEMGFVHSGPEAEKIGFHQKASEAGNANIGHEYGTDLTEEEKWALIEYLKTI